MVFFLAWLFEPERIDGDPDIDKREINSHPALDASLDNLGSQLTNIDANGSTIAYCCIGPFDFGGESSPLEAGVKVPTSTRIA